MASILKVDEMQGVTSAGDITITGEGGAATMQLQQGLAKCWHDANNAAVLEDSLNISSSVDNGTGNYQFNINNNMSAANYAIPNTTSVAEISEIDAGDQATNRYDIQVFGRQDSFSNADNITQAVVHGDLA